MANSDIRRFFYYQQYIWRPGDFTNLQAWLDDETHGLFEGLVGGAVLSGCKAIPGGALAVQISSGIAATPSGRIVVVPTTDSATFASPAGNPSANLLVLRPTATNMDNIPQPTDPNTQVPLDYKYGYTLVALNGTPAATPQYPTPQADDIIIMGVRLASGAATITAANFDLSPVMAPRKRQKSVRSVASNYTLQDSDEILEVSATGGNVTITVPSAGQQYGKEFMVMRIDSTGNDVDVTSGDLISGQGTVTLDDQWSSLRIYSNNLSWRSF